jgi:hypothetical protein
VQHACDKLFSGAVCAYNSGLVSIDGKTTCGAKAGGKSLFHVVSAFCHANGVCPAQVRTEEKSNEVTAIPELIKMLDVTIGEDASRKRAKNSPQNFSVIFKTALTMLKNHNPVGGGAGAGEFPR